MDGVQLAERLDGIALAVDPGEHAFTFSSAGQPEIRKSFVIRQGDKDRHERIAFGPPPGLAAPPPADVVAPPRRAYVAPPPPADAAPAVTATARPPRAQAPPASSGGAQRTLAVISSAATVAALAVGVTGSIVESMASNDMRHLTDTMGNARCFARNGAAVDAQGMPADADCAFYLDRYNVAREAAIAGYIAAGALAVTSVILWLTDGGHAPPPAREEAAAGWSCAPSGLSEPGLQCRLRF
jgi:hypothetical protein